MINLQVGLIIGGIFFSSIIFRNKWKAYKKKKIFEKYFPNPHCNVLINSTSYHAEIEKGLTRNKPSLHEDFGQIIKKKTFALGKSLDPLKNLPLDLFFDCTILLELTVPCSGEKILSASQDLHRLVIRKYIYLEKILIINGGKL